MAGARNDQMKPLSVLSQQLHGKYNTHTSRYHYKTLRSQVYCLQRTEALKVQDKTLKDNGRQNSRTVWTLMDTKCKDNDRQIIVSRARWLK